MGHLAQLELPNAYLPRPSAPTAAPPAEDAPPAPLGNGPVTDYLRTVVHELRTPLTAISGHVQFARQRKLRDPEQCAAALDHALAQVVRMDRMITELLDRSRVADGTVALDVVVFDLCAVVVDVIEQQEHIGIPFVLDRDTPALRVRGDPLRVAQIVGNLLTNAVKYGCEASPIEVTLRAEGAEAHLRVTDHGVGVPPDEQERLFEPYFRSTRTRGRSGTGLGLSISRSLAERQGGRLWLERSGDDGSVFTLALPVAGAN